MAHSSILGADVAPALPSGRGADVLGPSDNSDSGSDTVGTAEAYADSDAAGTGERGSVNPGEGREGGDIMPDRVAGLPSGDALPDAETAPDGLEMADLGDEEPEDDSQ